MLEPTQEAAVLDAGSPPRDLCLTCWTSHATAGCQQPPSDDAYWMPLDRDLLDIGVIVLFIFYTISDNNFDGISPRPGWDSWEPTTGAIV